MRILLTAFEPFDGTGLNASLEGCRAFLARWGEEWDLRFAVLPVEYGPDLEVVERALAEGPVDVLLHTGQASGAAAVRVERLAVNVRYAAGPGEAEAQQRIEEEGPAALFATLPVERISAAICAAGVPATVSNHGGIYLCNHAFYQSLRRAERSGSGPRAGFLHVPCLPEQVAPGQPCLEPELVAIAIRAALLCLSSD